MDRRHFLETAAALSTLALLSPTQLLADQFGEKRFLSQLAYRNAVNQGEFQLSQIEGELPEDLKGTLVRVGPGQKENQGTKLKHYFDGDAFYQKVVFQNKAAPKLRAGFVETPQRKKELKKGRMIYDEFGTEAPKKTRERKNTPNVNMIRWQDSFLALSEGGAPARLDQKSLKFLGHETFKGTLPDDVGFSAHPKKDPRTGIHYGFGITQGISKSLVVFKMDQDSGKLTELYNLWQSKVHMIHDMMITENFLVFYIPPAYFKLTDIIFDRGSLADALRYDQELGSRLIILDKNGKKKPIEIDLPSKLAFHHANAYEENGNIIIQSFLAEDASLLKFISSWHLRRRMSVKTPSLYEMTINPDKEKLISSRELLKNHDFPVIHPSFIGSKQSYIYATEMGNTADPMSFRGITKLNTQTGVKITFEAREHEIVGEAIFVPRGNEIEDHAYLIVPGYDQNRDESFLVILETENMTEVSRVWMEGYFPLGFHGNFYTHS